MKTNHEKLEGVRAELTILLPRLTEQYRPGIKTCLEWLKEVQDDIAKDNENKTD